MIIDLHTHIFPDKIASATIRELESHLPDGQKAHSDGTLAGLLSTARAGEVAYSVLLPVVTAPKQFDSINRFAEKAAETKGILAFGGIHPDNDRIEERLQSLKDRGFPGIKLHPDYQHCYINDPRYVRIIRTCVELDLMVSIHAGVDIGYPDPVHCPPELTAEMLDQVYENREPEKANIILAHLGGHDMYRDVERYLAGRNLYLDTAYSVDQLPVEDLMRLIRKHGTDKIVFGTDSPWTLQKQQADYIRSLPLTEEEKEQIFWKNAASFLPVNS
ncbi:MAG: TatD family hydrolase [Lachnospiraceae bacterium]|nr:TatD family hydrolase [Lachnospiraceae bacterium]